MNTPYSLINHGGGNIKCAVVKSWSFGDGAKYRATLRENLLQAENDLRLGQKFFQKAKDIKQTARATVVWFRSKNNNMLQCLTFAGNY